MSLTLRGGHLTLLRRIDEQRLAHICDVWRAEPTEDEDDEGNLIPGTPSRVAQDVACRLSRLSEPGEDAEPGETLTTIYWELTAAVTVDISESDTIRNVRDQTDTLVTTGALDVQSVAAGSFLARIICVEVR